MPQLLDEGLVSSTEAILDQDFYWIITVSRMITDDRSFVITTSVAKIVNGLMVYNPNPYSVKSK